MSQNYWKERFSYTILSRGEELLNSGKLDELYEKNGRYTASVTDGKSVYVPSVTINGNILKRMSCTCAYHRNNKYCKHIAALIYRIEDEKGSIYYPEKTEKTKKEEKTAPREYARLVYNDDGEPHYFSFGTSLDLYRPTPATLSKAEKIVKRKKVFSRDVKLDTKSGMKELVYSSKVEEGGRTAVVKIVLVHSGIKEISCLEDRWYGNKLIGATCGLNTSDRDGVIELCTHKTAALMDLMSFLEKNRDFTDYTDTTASYFIENFSRDRKTSTEEEDESDILDIEPVLDDEDMVLRIRMKDGKKYQISRIDDFYDSYKEKKRYTLKNITVDFSETELSPRGRKIIKLIDIASSYCYTFNRRHSFDRIDITSSIPYSDIIDEFFETMKGSPVTYRKETLIGFRDAEPALRVKIEEKRERDKTVGVTVSGYITGYWRSEKYIYWVEDGYFNRTPSSGLGASFAFSYATDGDGRFSFTVGKSELDNFYNRILPEIRSYGEVEDTAYESISEFLTEPPKAEFHVDGDTSRITCRAVLVYRGVKYRVYPYGTYNKEPSFRDKTALKPYGEDLLRELEDIFPRSYSPEGLWTVGESENDIYTFLKRGIGRLRELGEVTVTGSVDNMTVRRMPQLSGFFDIDNRNDSILDFRLDLQGFTIEELQGILDSYRENRKYHRLGNGDFVSLSGVNLNTLTSLFSDSGLSLKDFVDGEMHIPLYRTLYLNEILSRQHGISYEGGERLKKLIDGFSSMNRSGYMVPSSLEGVMREYQKEGYRWMKTLYEYGFGGILADDMGLGKTVQALSLLLSLKEEGKQVNALIVSPSSLVYNWKAEAEKFTPSLKTVTVTGTAQQRAAILSRRDNYDILITSYDLLKRDINRYEGISFNIEIIDEAQFIKNHDTAASKAVRAVSATHRMALTGTPIENRLSELWSIFEYLMPGFLFSREKYREIISDPIEKNGSRKAAGTLKKLTGPFILRRLKADVLNDLPDKIEETRVIALEGEQKKLYTAEAARTLGMLKGNGNYGEQKIEILAELMKMREICCDPSLVYEDYRGTSAKREAVMELIASAIDGGHRILVFSQFTSMLALLEKDLEKAGIRYFKLTGETEKEKRLELVDSFNEGTVPVFLISLKAGGTGLNLTGADIVIHYDPWWNTAVENQATDRAHRIGQTHDVTVYKMIARDTIEEKIVELQERKKSLADEIVSTGSITLSSLSKEDLMELLSISQM